MRNKFLIFYIVFFGLHLSSYSQRKNIRFENISIDHGLSQNSVVSICQDRKGFLWFGTYDGLNRYDGYKFKVFKNIPGDTTSLSKNLVWDIFEDHFGNIWVGTNGGLNKYNSEKESFRRFNENPDKSSSISSNKIRTIFEDKSGILWIGTENGLNRYNSKNNSFKVYKNNPTNSSSISNNVIRIIFEDSYGNLWVGTDDGLNLFDRQKEKFYRYTHDDSNPNSISENIIYSICEDSNGYIWVGTRSGGLNKFDKKNQIFKHYKYDPKNPNSIRYNYITALFKDKSGDLWIGTYGGGLEKYDPVRDNFIHYQNDISNPQSISSNAIYCIMEDRSGILWIGTDFGGVNKYDKLRNQFEYYSNEPGNPKSLRNNSINCFYEDPSDNGKTMWIGTWKGLVLYNRQSQEFKSFVNNPVDEFSLSNNIVRTIAKDSEGFLWVGTDNGVNRFDVKENKFHRYFNQTQNISSISNDQIRDILIDNLGGVWIASNSSLIDKYDRIHDSFSHFVNDIANIKTQLNIVWVLLQDHNGNIYAGSDAGGLSKFDKKNGKFVPFASTENTSLAINNNKVLTVSEDKKGNLLIGTAGGGLNCLDLSTGRCRVISEQDGLISNTIHGVIEDKFGDLWVTTNRGLSRIDLTRNKIDNFNMLDGLQSNEFHVNSFCYSQTGEIFIGGIRGFNLFRPESIRENKFIPPIVFTDIQLFNKSIQIDKSIDGRLLLNKSITELKNITLSYRDEVFTIEFSSLDYAAPGKNSYSYFLEGYDKIWNNIGNRHYATYTKIPAGKYRLIVIGSNHNGLWNKTGISLEIVITPPFWETWWFRSIMGVLILSGLIIVYLYRTRRIRAHNRELERHVKIRTEELDNANVELKVQVEKQKEYEMMLQESLEKEKELNEMKSRFITTTSHEFRTPLTSVLSSTELLQRYSSKWDDNKKSEHFERIYHSIEYLTKLIEDVLTISKTDSGKINYNPDSVDLFQLASECKKDAIALMTEKHELKLNYNTEEKTFILDRKLMKFIFNNLLSNAIKYSPAGGKIEMTINTDKKNLIIEILDEGIGIPIKDKDKIFDSFYRSKNIETIAGTGLGLAIVKRAVDFHNGSIIVNSELNKGTTFVVKIPKV